MLLNTNWLVQLYFGYVHVVDGQSSRSRLIREDDEKASGEDTNCKWCDIKKMDSRRNENTL